MLSVKSTSPPHGTTSFSMSSLLISGTGVTIPAFSTTFTRISTSFVDPSGNLTVSCPVFSPTVDVSTSFVTVTVAPVGAFVKPVLRSTFSLFLQDNVFVDGVKSSASVTVVAPAYSYQYPFCSPLSGYIFLLVEEVDSINLPLIGPFSTRYIAKTVASSSSHIKLFSDGLPYSVFTIS